MVQFFPLPIAVGERIVINAATPAAPALSQDKAPPKTAHHAPVRECQQEVPRYPDKPEPFARPLGSQSTLPRLRNIYIYNYYVFFFFPVAARCGPSSWRSRPLQSLN